MRRATRNMCRMFTVVGEAIRQRRQELGLSAIQLGQRLGVSHQAVYEWENGKSVPAFRKWPAIAEALEAEWLIELRPVAP